MLGSRAKVIAEQRTAMVHCTMGRSIDTIMARVSERSFEPRPLEPDAVDAVRALLERESAPGPFGGASRFVMAGSDEMQALGRLGTYGVIRGAPGFVIGVIPGGARAMEDFGYRFEGVVLAATALGLGTCWLAGTFNRSAASRLAGLSDVEIVPAVTPIGYPASRRTLVDGALRLVARSSSRIAFEELFHDSVPGRPLTREAAGRWAEVLECVRRGPSASNRQPWRIVLEDEQLHLFLAENPLYNRVLGSIRLQSIDMGIAMRHVAEAAADLGIPGSWSRAEAEAFQEAEREHGLSYVATWG